MAEAATRFDRRPGHRAPDLFHRRESSLPAEGSAIFEAVDRGDFKVVTSFLTLTEVLVHPLHGDHDLANQYRHTLLHARRVTTLPIADAIAE